VGPRARARAWSGLCPWSKLWPLGLGAGIICFQVFSYNMLSKITKSMGFFISLGVCKLLKGCSKQGYLRQHRQGSLFTGNCTSIV
jgi:hypothetical protein